MGGGVVAVAGGGVHETATGSVVTRTNLQSIPKYRTPSPTQIFKGNQKDGEGDSGGKGYGKWVGI